MPQVAPPLPPLPKPPTHSALPYYFLPCLALPQPAWPCPDLRVAELRAETLPRKGTSPMVVAATGWVELTDSLATHLSVSSLQTSLSKSPDLEAQIPRVGLSSHFLCPRTHQPEISRRLAAFSKDRPTQGRQPSSWAAALPRRPYLSTAIGSITQGQWPYWRVAAFLEGSLL